MSISTLHLDASDSMAQQWPHARGEEGRGGGQGRDRTCPGALHPGHSLTGLPSVSAYQSMHVTAHQLSRFNRCRTVTASQTTSILYNTYAPHTQLSGPWC